METQCRRFRVEGQGWTLVTSLGWHIAMSVELLLLIMFGTAKLWLARLCRHERPAIVIVQGQSLDVKESNAGKPMVDLAKRPDRSRLGQRLRRVILVHPETEYYDRHHWVTKAEARHGVGTCIEDRYNRRRRH